MATHYHAGQVVLAHYSQIRVGRCLTRIDADLLNMGSIPWRDVVKVRIPRRAVHYFECSGEAGLAYDIQATTCRRCLMGRAKQLQGWRWTHPANAEEVQHLKRALGARVDGYETKGDTVMPPEFNHEGGRIDGHE